MSVKSHSITSTPNKSKLLCYNVTVVGVLPPSYLNAEMIPVVDSDKHLGIYISPNITDIHIIDNIYDLYQRSNWVISNFRVFDSSTRIVFTDLTCIVCVCMDLNCGI